MDNNNNMNTAANAAEGSAQATQEGAAAGEKANTKPAEDTVTMSKADYDKAIQSAEDKLRTSYSKRIKELEDKITALTPPVKSEAERDLEQRIADLEKKEKENEAKAKELALKSSLQSKNLDTSIADYLKADVDTDAFSAVIDKVVAARVAASGYKPTGHQNNQPVTKEQFDKMSYDERAELYDRSPELYKRFKH